MELRDNGSDTNLKVVDPFGRVVGYVWQTPNEYWHASTAEESDRRLIRAGLYRPGKGYTSSSAALDAVAVFVATGEGA